MEFGDEWWSNVIAGVNNSKSGFLQNLFGQDAK